MSGKPPPASSDNAILDLLAREGRAMAVREMIRMLGVPAEGRPAFRKRVRALSGEGVLVRVRSRYALPESLSIFRGTFRGHPEGYGFVIVECAEGKKEPDIFIKRSRTRGAMDGDLVAARVERTGPDGRREGSVADIIQRAHERLVGRLVVDRRRAWVEPQERRIAHPVMVTLSKRGGARHGEWVEVELEKYPTSGEDARGCIVRAFGYPDDPAVEQEMILAKWNIRDEFPEKVLKEAAGLHPPAEDDPFPAGVEDLRHLTVFTIDPRTARDRDDAISIEKISRGWRLGVHIADVSHYVRAGSEIDKEAALRGNSVYFPDRAIPMLPPALSGDVCSLAAGRVRRTLSAFLDFDAKGRQAGFRLAVARIRSRAELTYAGAGAVLEGGKIPEKDEYGQALEFRDELSELAALADLLRHRRVEGGSLDFDLPEAVVSLDERGDPLSIDRAPRGAAHRLIEECMLAANRSVAGILAEEIGSAVFRVHEAPDEESLEGVRVALSRLGMPAPRTSDLMGGRWLQSILDAASGGKMERYVNLLVLRSMKLARYEPSPALHFGLGFEPYTHFTSPIRRYTDLIVHRRLKRIFRGDRRKPDRRRLAEVCAHISEREREAESAEREMVDFHKALFMRDRIGERYSGHVSGVTAFGLFVELKENFVEGMVPLEALSDDYYHHLPEEHSVLGERTGRRFRLGDPVTIRVVSVDLGRREVAFQLLAGGSREVPLGETGSRRSARTVGRKRPQRGAKGKQPPARKSKLPRKRPVRTRRVRRR
ncbi:ribonuclease R [Nitrospinota bacterium]